MIEAKCWNERLHSSRLGEPEPPNVHLSAVMGERGHFNEVAINRYLNLLKCF